MKRRGFFAAVAALAAAPFVVAKVSSGGPLADMVKRWNSRLTPGSTVSCVARNVSGKLIEHGRLIRFCPSRGEIYGYVGDGLTGHLIGVSQAWAGADPICPGEPGVVLYRGFVKNG